MDILVQLLMWVIQAGFFMFAGAFLYQLALVYAFRNKGFVIVDGEKLEVKTC